MRLLAASLCTLLLNCGSQVLQPMDFPQTRAVLAGQEKGVVIVSHRGNGFDGPENSLEAFGQCVEYGVTNIETDVRYTKDQVPVLMHDESIRRTTNGTGRVNEMTLDEIRQFTLRNGEPVPTLDDALQQYGRKAMLYLHIKEDDLYPAVESVAKQNMFDTVRFLTFYTSHHRQLPELQKKYPRMKVMPRAEGVAHVDQLDRFGVKYDMLKVHSDASPDFIRSLRKRGIVVSANLLHPFDWGKLDHYLSNNVSVILTDRPAKYVKQKPVQSVQGYSQ